MRDFLWLEWPLNYRKLFSTTTTFYFTLFAARIPGAQGLDKNNLQDNLVLFYYFRFRLCCPCLQFHFIVWRSAELNVFGVEEMALANMQIKNLEVTTVYANMGKYKITSNVKLWKLFVCLSLFIYLQVNTSALSDMIDPSERKVSEFPTVGENCARTNGVVCWCGYIAWQPKTPLINPII